MKRQLLYHKRSRSDFAGVVSPSISLLSKHHPFEKAVGFDLHSLLWMDLFSCKTNWNYMNQLKLFSVRCRFRFKLAIVSVKWVSLKMLTSSSNCNWEFGKCFYKTTLGQGLISFWVSSHFFFFLTTKMTSGSPLSPSFESSLSTSRRFLVICPVFYL